MSFEHWFQQAGRVKDEVEEIEEEEEVDKMVTCRGCGRYFEVDCDDEDFEDRDTYYDMCGKGPHCIP